MFEKSYQRAIEAREHHYSNFNHWMNFYTITIGALFIGYYTVKEDDLLKTIITFIGFATTFAWLQSFRGYYHWIKHWMNVVMFHEERYLKSIEKDGITDDNMRIYSLYYESDEENSHCPLKTRNISTQKMTLRLIFVLLLSWLILLVKNCCSLLGIHFCTVCEKDCQCECIVCSLHCQIILVCVGVLLALVLLFCYSKESDIFHHYRLKGNAGDYTVLPPNNKNNSISNNHHKKEKK